MVGESRMYLLGGVVVKKVEGLVRGWMGGVGWGSGREVMWWGWMVVGWWGSGRVGCIVGNG